MKEILLIIVAVAVIILVTAVFMPTKEKREKKKQNSKKFFVLRSKSKEIRFFNPFIGFLVYGGAGSGKTKSVGKPLLEEYIKNHFAGFIYDYKDYDITKTALHLTEKHKYPYDFHVISFTDINLTSRTNPIDPDVVKDENVFLQLLDDLFMAYIKGGQNEWTEGAKGILQGVGYRLFSDIRQYCTIPHLAIFICTAGADRLTTFLKGNHRSRSLASAFLDSEKSPRTQASYLSTLTNALSKLSFNKNVAYVLTGDDFKFNLLDEKEPKLISVCNSYQIESVISPIIALMLSMSSRHFTISNRVNFFYFLDEATSFKIPDFHRMPSLLREYKCSISFITQSASNLEIMYGKQAKSSIESNLGNQFFGRTQDVSAIQSYPIIFGKWDAKRVSKSSGRSGGGMNQSTTISTQKEDVFEPKRFTELLPGEFICNFNESNTKSGKFRFSQYVDAEKDIDEFHKNADPDINSIYESILNDVELILKFL